MSTVAMVVCLVIVAPLIGLLCWATLFPGKSDEGGRYH